ncbi:PAS and ANTAR domain-containing protein [Mycolicibacterium goodii]|uniref:Antitermination regulator n=1 Tax=Mycolicibacterium goodii TaxID=134601 RepID=A0A0K0XFP6_MYCGD|nr:antitermination regulator [Mycolicibacterium goodii]
MTRGSEGGAAAVARALSGGTPQHIGWFRFYFADERWEWSAELQRMHGYRPGTVTPTTELVLSHKHPDDRDQVAADINDMIIGRRPLGRRHRIIDTTGAVREVIVVSDQLHGHDGDVLGIRGFYIDVTPVLSQQEDAAITAEVAKITERRAVIEQVKGMLMLIYGIDENAAFDLLKWLSQENNVKLRVLAEQAANDFTTLGDAGVLARSKFDRLLLTAARRAVDSDDDSLSTSV